MRIFGFTRADLRLLLNLTFMNIRDRYMGSNLGCLWAIGTPFLTLGLYTYVFGFVFKAKIPGAETTFAYAIWMMLGLVPYLSFSEGILSATGSIISGANMVKNVVFKTELLCYAAVLSSGITLIAGIVFIFALGIIDGNYPTWHVILLIPVVILQFGFIAGVGLFLSCIAVFFRDLIQILPTVITISMFLTPIFYSIDMMPGIVKRLTFFNPLFQITQPYRDIFLLHKVPDLIGLLYLALLTGALLLLGQAFFRRLRGYFEMRM